MRLTSAKAILISNLLHFTKLSPPTQAPHEVTFDGQGV